MVGIGIDMEAAEPSAAVGISRGETEMHRGVRVGRSRHARGVAVTALDSQAPGVHVEARLSPRGGWDGCPSFALVTSVRGRCILRFVVRERSFPAPQSPPPTLYHESRFATLGQGKRGNSRYVGGWGGAGSNALWPAVWRKAGVRSQVFPRRPGLSPELSAAPRPPAKAGGMPKVASDPSPPVIALGWPKRKCTEACQGRAPLPSPRRPPKRVNSPRGPGRHCEAPRGRTRFRR